jgi:sugar/nucleoside kinase (ribokinase family)
MGIIPFDLLFSVPSYPAAGLKINASAFHMQGGGPVPNVAVGLARLGYKAALITTVGNDPFGDIIKKELRQDKVDTRFIITKKQPSALAAGWIESGSGRRTMVLSRQIFVKPSDVTTSRYPIPRILHLDGRDMPATMKLARWGKRVGAIVSFDIGSMRNDVSEVFPYVDHLVVADGYAFPYTKTRAAESAIAKLATICPGTVVVTEGIKGSTGLERSSGKFIRQPAFKVENVDTTGAGDCYHTGYLFGLLRGLDLAECMRLGAAAGALKCTKPGARTGIPRRGALMRFLNSNPPVYE